jgi:hypothetical protein
LPGVWNTGDWNKTLDVRVITGPLDNVKLLISTSCATLCKEAYEVWKRIFPKAVFLGAAVDAAQGLHARERVREELPEDLLFDEGGSGVSGAVISGSRPSRKRRPAPSGAAFWTSLGVPLISGSTRRGTT